MATTVLCVSNQWLLSWFLHKWREGYLLPTWAPQVIFSKLKLVTDNLPPHSSQIKSWLDLDFIFTSSSYMPLMKCLVVVCRVGEHQHWLAHRCSLCEKFPHIHEAWNIMGYGDGVVMANWVIVFGRYAWKTFTGLQGSTLSGHRMTWGEFWRHDHGFRPLWTPTIKLSCEITPVILVVLGRNSRGPLSPKIVSTY